MEGKNFMSCCKKIVFNIADFSMIYKQQKGHVCAATFEKKASNLHILSMCGSIDGFLHPWINGRELSHWMKRGTPIEFHRDCHVPIPETGEEDVTNTPNNGQTAP